MGRHRALSALGGKQPAVLIAAADLGHQRSGGNEPY